MRWFRTRRAGIPSRHRQRFEELGAEIVRAYFTQPVGVIVYSDDNGDHTVRELHDPMQLWLREQYDRAERKETWLISMEIAITLFVASELFMAVLEFWSRHSKQN